MTVERGVRIMAGIFPLVTVGLGMPGSPFFVDEKFPWLTVFDGVNQIQAGITGFYSPQPTSPPASPTSP